MERQETRKRLRLLIRVGLPYTVIGMGVVFLGLYGVRHFFRDSDYLSLLLFSWLAVFWFIYQPLFKKKIQHIRQQLDSKRNSTP
jgi:hypothetical protein